MVFTSFCTREGRVLKACTREGRVFRCQMCTSKAVVFPIFQIICVKEGIVANFRCYAPVFLSGPTFCT